MNKLVIKKEEIVFTFFFIILFFLFKNNPFFWDSVQLSSMQAHFFYENNFSKFFLIDDIDSGHPPTMGIILAFLWQILGKELWVGHLLIALLCIGIVFQLKLLSTILFPKNEFWIMLIILSDATFLAQSSLVSPDIWVVFFFLMTLNGVLKNQKWLIIFGNMGLCIISTRGAMLGLSITTFHFYNSNFKLKTMVYFLPGFLLVFAFQGSHFLAKGWILYHQYSPWVLSFEKTNLSGFFRNIILLGWRLCDNGRVLNMILLFIFVINYRKSILKNPIFVLLICVGVFTVFPLLQYKNLLGHRYLLPFIFVVNFFIFQYLLQKISNKFIITMIFLFQLSGNFWVYPDRISKGWDATLAYYPYSFLLKEAEKFRIDNSISKQKISTAFPLNMQKKYYELSNDTTKYTDFKSLKSSEYVLYSNILNGFSDEQLDSLKTYFNPIYKTNFLQVKVILYSKI